MKLELHIEHIPHARIAQSVAKMKIQGISAKLNMHVTTSRA